jgi:hypothetical protein
VTQFCEKRGPWSKIDGRVRLADDNVEVRRAAARVLGRLGGTRAVEALVGALVQRPPLHLADLVT